MERRSSLPYSQAPATCPCPELTPSSPHKPFPPPEDPSEYYPPIYVLVSPMISFPRVSPPKPFLHPQPEDAPCRGDRDPQTRGVVLTKHTNAT